MHNKHHGFLIIELLIYGALFALFTLMVSTWVITIYLPMKKASHACIMVPTLGVLQDIFMRDIRQAPMDVKSWKKKGESELIWYQSDLACDIGWYLTPEHTIVRIQGHYNQEERKWEHKTLSVLAHQVKMLRITVHQPNDAVTSVAMVILLDNDKYPYHGEGTLRQRIL